MIYEKLMKLRFGKVARGVRNTPPITYRESKSVTILSMVGNDTVDMYLLAIKSFMKNFGYGNIEVINDGSLTEGDINVLHDHIPGVNISDSSMIDTLNCPSYISWKRLFRAQQLAESSYVIQLDSDTLSLGPLVDVHNHVQSNTGFLTGSKRWNGPVDVEFLDGVVSQWQSTHVQARAEKNFKNLSFFENGTTYLRGCAGFAGYPQNFADVQTIVELSKSIQKYVGDDWLRWGSEQTTTMCLISKCTESKILPWPYYQNYGMPFSSENTRAMNLVHFIGTNRFKDSTYLKLSKVVIRDLSKT